MNKNITDPSIFRGALPTPYKGGRTVELFTCEGAIRELCNQKIGCTALVDVTRLANPEALVADMRTGMCDMALELSGLVEAVPVQIAPAATAA